MPWFLCQPLLDDLNDSVPRLHLLLLLDKTPSCFLVTPSVRIE